jgi:hypothetical protein
VGGAIFKAGFCLAWWLAAANAQTNQCRFYLADQYDFPNNLGLALDLETSSNAGSVCQLNTAQLALGIADGKNFRFTVSKPQWQVGHDYVAKAVITPTGSQLFLDDQLLGSVTGALKPLAESALRVGGSKLGKRGGRVYDQPVFTPDIDWLLQYGCSFLACGRRRLSSAATDSADRRTSSLAGGL